MKSCSSSVQQIGSTRWKSRLSGRNGIILGLIALAGIGLAFGGGWGWLVAIGAAPVILSLLPCAVMCGLGLCMMGKTNKKAAPEIAAPQDQAAAPVQAGPEHVRARGADIVAPNL